MRDLEGGGGGGTEKAKRERESASNWTLTTSCPLHRVITGRQRGARQPDRQTDWQKQKEAQTRAENILYCTKQRPMK